MCSREKQAPNLTETVSRECLTREQAQFGTESPPSEQGKLHLEPCELPGALQGLSNEEFVQLGAHWSCGESRGDAAVHITQIYSPSPPFPITEASSGAGPFLSALGQSFFFFPFTRKQDGGERSNEGKEERGEFHEPVLAPWGCAHLESKGSTSGLFPRRFVAAPTGAAQEKAEIGIGAWLEESPCFAGGAVVIWLPAACYRVICSPFVRQMFWGGHLGAPQPQNSSFHNFCQHRLTCKSLQMFSITPGLGSYRTCSAFPGKEREAKSEFPQHLWKGWSLGALLWPLFGGLQNIHSSLLRDSCPWWNCICQQLSGFNHFSSKNGKIILKSLLFKLCPSPFCNRKTLLCQSRREQNLKELSKVAALQVHPLMQERKEDNSIV